MKTLGGDMRKHKQTTIDWDELKSSIPNLRQVDNPTGDEYRAVGRRLRELRERLPLLRRKRDAAAQAGNGSAGFRLTQEVVAQDTACVADGGSIEALQCETVIDERATIHRQIRATEEAVEVLADRLRALEVKLALEELEKLGDVGRAIGTELCEAYERLDSVLRNCRELYAFMHRRAFPHSILKGTAWCLESLDCCLLNGGPNFPSISCWVEMRKRAWGLDEPQKRRKRA
jgi:hypothetical protein